MKANRKSKKRNIANSTIETNFFKRRVINKKVGVVSEPVFPPPLRYNNDLGSILTPE